MGLLCRFESDRGFRREFPLHFRKQVTMNTEIRHSHKSGGVIIERRISDGPSTFVAEYKGLFLHNGAFSATTATEYKKEHGASVALGRAVNNIAKAAIAAPQPVSKSVSTTFCQECGNHAPGKFCGHCGAKQDFAAVTRVETVAIAAATVAPKAATTKPAIDWAKADEIVKIAKEANLRVFAGEYGKKPSLFWSKRYGLSSFVRGVKAKGNRHPVAEELLALADGYGAGSVSYEEAVEKAQQLGVAVGVAK